jgi:large subunit ribosomal protein L4
MKLPVYNSAGEKVSEAELTERIFAVPAKVSVVHQAVVAQEHNARQVLAHTKDRSEVSGGGKKPWKQKGTGRARHGSIRSPLWVGGGITFGPRKDRNFKVKINKKAKNLALRMVLSDKVKEGQLVIVKDWELAEMKTKKFAAILKKLPVKTDKALVALAKTDPKLVAVAKNLKKVFACGAGSLNVIDLLKYKYLVVSLSALKELEQVYGGKTANELK